MTSQDPGIDLATSSWLLMWKLLEYRTKSFCVGDIGRLVDWNMITVRTTFTNRWRASEWRVSVASSDRASALDARFSVMNEQSGRAASGLGKNTAGSWWYTGDRGGVRVRGRGRDGSTIGSKSPCSGRTIQLVICLRAAAMRTLHHCMEIRLARATRVFVKRLVVSEITSPSHFCPWWWTNIHRSDANQADTAAKPNDVTAYRKE